MLQRLSQVRIHTLFQNPQFQLGKQKKIKSVYARIKYYSKHPERYRLKTKIRPPDLNAPNLEFPLKMPIRYRHIRIHKKQLFIDNSSKIHWQRLQPNQILLGLQHPQYLSFSELTEGLRYLSELKGQQQHDWNNHEWVLNAMNTLRDKFNFIKQKQTMEYYWLMKKLKYNDQIFWGKMYAKIEHLIYQLYQQEFQYIFTQYYERIDQIFSPDAKENFIKLMQGRIRQFKPKSIIHIFELFHKEKRLDTYWLQNVFISLFKNNQYVYSPYHIARIFRNMMHIGHQDNQRLYTNLYARIATIQYKTTEQIEALEEVLEEVKEIFVSHRIEATLEILEQKKSQIQNLQKEQKKTLEQKVKDDLRYFLEKRKLKQENAAI